MKIKYSATGIIEHVQNQVGRALINAGVATAMPDENAPGGIAKADTAPRWEVVHISSPERTFLAIQMKVLNQVHNFSGRPDALNERSFGHPVPKEIAREYRRQYEGNENLRDKFMLLPNVADETNAAIASELAARKAEGR
jgi:hypothetical protein